MKIEIEISDSEIREAICDHVAMKLGFHNSQLKPDNLYLFVKSKNNYKQDKWEPAIFLITNKQVEKTNIIIDSQLEFKGGINHVD